MQNVVVGQDTTAELTHCGIDVPADHPGGTGVETLTLGAVSCNVDNETLEVCDADQPDDAIEVTANSPTMNTMAVTVPIRRRISDSTLVPFAIDISHVSVYSTSERSYMASRMIVICFLFSCRACRYN